MIPADPHHISLLAAPIYATLLGLVRARVPAGMEIPAEALSEMRKHAIIQAQALWLDMHEQAAS